MGPAVEKGEENAAMTSEPMTVERIIFGDHDPSLPIEEIAKRSSQKFVRSDAEMAFYEPERDQSGRVLTAWEAYKTYGLDILREALDYGAAIILHDSGSVESAFRKRRERLGLSVEEVARAVNLPPDEVELAETNSGIASIRSMDRIAFALGMDENLLAWRPHEVADDRLAIRLKTLQTTEREGDVRLSVGAVLALTEAASIIRVQSQLQETLGLEGRAAEFEPYPYYGSPENPAWSVGYDLADKTRARLGLGNRPIDSMRALVEDTLGIPVAQARMSPRIAGATVSAMDGDGRARRGIVLNTVGQNRNVWARRATLAHEMAHLLYDPEDMLEKTRVDSYEANEADPENGYCSDFVEQRANAFAIAFLAPNGEARRIARPPTSGESVSRLMSRFGISLTSARFHLNNVNWGQHPTPDLDEIPQTYPSDEQRAAEDFAADYFPINNTPIQRRGRFAGLVASACENNLISDHTAAAYLDCKIADFTRAARDLRDMYGLGR